MGQGIGYTNVRLQKMHNLLHTHVLHSGSVACRVLKDDKVQVLVDNMKSGFDLFVIDHSAEHLVRYPVPNGERYTRSGAFGGEKDLVVCGSHKGRAFLYNLNSGTLLGTLKHAGSSGMIQTVAVCRLHFRIDCTNFKLKASRSSKEYLIATGAANGKHDVKIWSKQVSVHPFLNTSKNLHVVEA